MCHLFKHKRLVLTLSLPISISPASSALPCHPTWCGVCYSSSSSKMLRKLMRLLLLLMFFLCFSYVLSVSAIPATSKPFIGYLTDCSVFFSLFFMKVLKYMMKWMIDLPGYRNPKFERRRRRIFSPAFFN